MIPKKDPQVKREVTDSAHTPTADELKAWAAAIIKSKIGGAVPLPFMKKTPTPVGFQGGKNDMSKCCSIRAVRGIIQRGFTARDPETTELRHYEVGGMSIRPADGVIMIDIDCYGKKAGARRRSELEEKWGKLPRTYYLTSRGKDSPSRIMLFRATAGRKYGNPGGDIEIIQNHHRYGIGPPSVHPEGRPYVLYGPDGEVLLADEMPAVEDLAELPEDWDYGLAGMDRKHSNGQVSVDVRDWISEHGQFESCAQTDATLAHWLDRFAGKLPARGDSEFHAYNVARDASYAIISDCAAGHDGAWPALEQLRDAFFQAARGNGKADARIKDDWHRMVSDAINDKATHGERPDDDCPEDAGDIPPNLPDEFWEARPSLRHIRQAAHARCCSPDAVLAVLLARLSAMAPPALRRDAGGGPSPLTVFSAICGASEAGKTESMRAAMALLPELPDYGWLDKNHPAEEIFADDVPMGSGQGIAEAFYDSRYVEVGQNKDGTAKVRQERKKFRDHAFIIEDEGKSLTDKMTQTGSEHSAAIRRSWSGRTFGQRNASDQTTREVKEGTYSIGIAVGFQPGTIGPLLGEAEVGTPQRFVYMSATDPSIPDEADEWPGKLEVVWPDTANAIGFPAAVRAGISSARRGSSRGLTQTELPLRHRNLNRMRVAALLAVLDGRRDASQEDWDLAGIYWDVSGQVRDWMARYDTTRAEENEAGLRARLAGREVAKVSAVNAMEAATSAAYNAARNHASGPLGKNCPKGHSRRCITLSVSSKYRSVLGKEGMGIVFDRLASEVHFDES